jgi:hypothetical protein
MTFEELHSKWKARPFRPFRLVMKDGTTYEVTHPRYLMVGGYFFHFYYQDSPDVPFDDVDRRIPADIDRIEDLPVAMIPHSRFFPADAPGLA